MKSKKEKNPPGSKKDKSFSLPLLLRLIRRFSQGIFLIIFLWLIAVTIAVNGGGDAENANNVPWLVESFLYLDPLVGIMVFFSTMQVGGFALLGLIVLVSAIFLGRVFCGWVCPMGTLNHIVSQTYPSRNAKKRIKLSKPHAYQKIKYVLLFGILAAALAGSAAGGILDPICLCTRGMALTVFPVIQWMLVGILEALANSGVDTLIKAADAVYESAGGIFINERGFIVSGGMLVSLLFIAVLVANRVVGRFWCRAICPLGALLGGVSRFGILKLKKDSSLCNGCSKCETNCLAGAAPKADVDWLRSECHMCFNCESACPQNAIKFGLFSGRKSERAHPDVRRRALLAGAGAGAVMVPAMRTGSIVSVEGRPSPERIRPPGSADEKEFLKKCVRCSQCIKICPNNALHPAFNEAGLEGLWTPILVPRIGYCEPTCTLCTQVCPTGAISHLTRANKLGENNNTKISIGTAFVDRGRCLPWAMRTSCVVCEEFCPVSPRAITFEEKVLTGEGNNKIIKKPIVNPVNCNGCGACEYACPVHDKAAIRISSAGESRSINNRILLDNKS